MDEKILEWKTRKEWIAQARMVVNYMEKQGLRKIDDLPAYKKDELRQAFEALGEEVNF